MSFSWRGKLIWSAPPILFLIWLASDTLGGLTPLAWFLGLITVPYAVWWLRHVWTRAPLPYDPVNSSWVDPVPSEVVPTFSSAVRITGGEREKQEGRPDV